MTDKALPELTSAPCIQRREKPVLTRDDVPYPASLIFNAGICKYQGRYAMVFRNDYGPEGEADFVANGFAGTNLGLAFSDDGIHWTVETKPCIDLDKARKLIAPLIPNRDPQTELQRFYDPRLTVIDGRVHMCFAIDTARGLRGGIAVTDDFQNWEVMSASVPDNRNMVLFPEKIGGRYVRYERPVNAWGGNVLHGSQAAMWMSFSPDLRHWGDSRHVLSSAEIEFANDKMGPGAPPIRTPRGWLTTFHAVWRDDSRGKHGWEKKWPKIYSAGLMLTDLEDPSRILGRLRTPLLAPETEYETSGGYRNHVIFPGGMILEDSGEVKIYYGAADTVECLATAHVDDLIALCEPA